MINSKAVSLGLRRLLFVAFVSLTIFSQFSCSKKSSSLLTDDFSYASTNDGFEVGQKEQSDNYEVVQESAITPNIFITKSMIVHNIIELNIDFDDNIEQIIIVRQKEDLNAPFFILIADYIQAFEHYQCTSKLESSATNWQNFNLSLMDVTGDNNLEIICNGYNSKEEQTLDIFKFDTSSIDSGIKFYPIFNYASSGSIDISYKEEVQPTPIEVQEVDPNESDMIKKDIYHFSYLTSKENPVGAYEFVSTSQIPKVKFDDIKLRQIMDNPSIDSKFEFLSGQWILESKAKQKCYLNFDYYNKSFCIYTNIEKKENESTLENYDHITIRKILYNRVQIDGRNENHSFKMTSLKIVYLTMNTISVEIYDNDSSIARLKPNSDYSGTYKKVDDNHLESLFSKQVPPPAKLPSVSGIFFDQLNNQYIFEYPYYKIISPSNEVIENGGYAIYYATVPIFEMVKFDQRGTISQKETYRFTHNVTKLENKLFTSITLSKGKITVHGFKEIDQKPLIIEQKLILPED